MYFCRVFLPVETENDICFLEKSIIKFLFNFEVNFPLFNTEETKSLIIRVTCKKAHIHDTGFIAQIAQLIYVFPFQTNLT